MDGDICIVDTGTETSELEPSERTGTLGEAHESAENSYTGPAHRRMMQKVSLVASVLTALLGVLCAVIGFPIAALGFLLTAGLAAFGVELLDSE